MARHEDLQRELAIGRTMVLCGVVGLLTSMTLVFSLGVYAAFVATACVGAILKGGTTIRYAREGLKALPQLPKAKLLR